MGQRANKPQNSTTTCTTTCQPEEPRGVAWDGCSVSIGQHSVRDPHQVPQGGAAGCSLEYLVLTWDLEEMLLHKVLYGRTSQNTSPKLQGSTMCVLFSVVWSLSISATWCPPLPSPSPLGKYETAPGIREFYLSLLSSHRDWSRTLHSQCRRCRTFIRTNFNK